MAKTLDEFIQWREKSKKLKRTVVYYWEQGKLKVTSGVKWLANHPQESAVLLTVVTGLGAIVKKSLKYVTARRETYNKERYVYDHSANAYLKVRRPLNSNDVVRINELRRNNPGMRMSEALARLNLLD